MGCQESTARVPETEVVVPETQVVIPETQVITPAVPAYTITLQGIATNVGRKAFDTMLDGFTRVTERREAYGGRTPPEEKQRIEQVELEALRKGREERPGRDWPQAPIEEDGRRLVRDMRAGKVKALDQQKVKYDADGRVVQGSGYTSLATAGLAPLDCCDFVVVSAPGSDPRLFSNTVWYCACHGVGLAVVFEADWGDVWFWLWKRNVAQMVQAGKRLLLLTDQEAKIGFAQTMEVEHLRERGLDFSVMSIYTFVKQMDPLYFAACDGEDVEAVLQAPRTAGAPPPLEGRTCTGGTALHATVVFQRPASTLEPLCSAGLDVDAQTFDGLATPLWAAAQNGYCEQIEALLALRANPGIRACTGRTALEEAEFKSRGGVPHCDRAVQLLQQAQ